MPLIFCIDLTWVFIKTLTQRLFEQPFDYFVGPRMRKILLLFASKLIIIVVCILSTRIHKGLHQNYSWEGDSLDSLTSKACTLYRYPYEVSGLMWSLLEWILYRILSVQWYQWSGISLYWYHWGLINFFICIENCCP